MAILISDCPHPNCRATRVTMKALATTYLGAKGGIVHLQCQACGFPSAVHVTGDMTQFGFLMNMEGQITPVFKVIDSWPKPLPPQIPEHLPTAIEKSVLQAERNFAISGNEEAAGMMYRRAMEGALKTKFPEVTGSLDKRIKELVKGHHLPPALGDWAHEIRRLGNDAAHEDDGITHEELSTMRNFCDTLLRYVFTLPREIEIRRAARGEATTG